MSSSDKESKVVSLAGNPIFHHEKPSEWKAPSGEICLQQISDHIEHHIGKIETVYHEVMSDTVHIDVHIVKPSGSNPHIRLVTSGMSDLPMSVPETIDAPKYAELMATLPADWRLDEKSLEAEEWYWPIRLLKILARLPHKYQTWLGFGHTMPNGDPEVAFASNTKLSGAILISPLLAPEAFANLEIDAEKTITFYSVVPLYREEMQLKLRSGSGTLFELLDRKGITDLIQLDRANVAKKRFGLF